MQVRQVLICWSLLGALAGSKVQAQRTWPVDSLLKTWPVEQLRHTGHSGGRSVVRAVDSEHLYEKLRTDAGVLPVFADSLVLHYADLYGMPRRDEFEVLLGMAQVYFPMIEKELRRQGLPETLKYLPMALSAMNARAVSPTGEAGMWMLPYPVAVRYGLEVNASVDERRHDVKSTMAAVRYLKDLHARYGDWSLAVMAFTCGPANVARARQRTGGSTDQRTLYPHFTEEHRDVLPLLMAFIHLAARSTELGMLPVPVNPWEPVDTLRTGNDLRFGPMAQVLDLPLAHIRHVNPTLCGDLVAKEGTFFLPRGQGARFTLLADSILRVQQGTGPATVVPEAMVEVGRTISYRVRSGDNLGSIAQRHRVTVSQLKKWNGLRSDRINAGKKLVIHTRVKQPVKAPAEAVPELPIEDGPTNNVGPRPAAPAPHVSYTVQAGDSLFDIAKRYPGVSATDIMEANGITAHIKPGQLIKIPRP